MKYYFDIDFIRSFSYTKLSDFVRADFTNFVLGLKKSPYKKIDCIIFHDEELELSDLEDNHLYEMLCDSNYSFRKKGELLSIIEDEESTSFKFFFVDTHLPGTNISNDYGFYSTNSHELNSNWQIVSSKNRCRKTLSNSISPYNISNWNDMRFCKLPLNCIVFSDRYFLKDRKSFEINLFALLQTLGISSLRKRKLDIFMLSEVFRENSKNEDFEIKRKKDNEQFVETFSNIHEFLNESIGLQNYNFTLIKVDRSSEVKPNEIHDRLLITNVLLMNPGNSFDFFESTKGETKIKAGTIINFDNFLWDDARGPIFELISQLKQAFDKVCDREQTGSQGPIYRILTHNNKSCSIFK